MCADGEALLIASPSKKIIRYYDWETISSLSTTEKSIITFGPNPTDAKLQIILDKPYQNITAEVYNISGHLITRKNYQNTSHLSLPLKGLKGQFIVCLYSPSKFLGNLLFTKL